MARRIVHGLLIVWLAVQIENALTWRESDELIAIGAPYEGKTFQDGECIDGGYPEYMMAQYYAAPVIVRQGDACDDLPR